MGLGTTLCHTYSAIFECYTGPPQQVDMHGAGTKRGRGRKERSEIEEKEFTIYD
jgi:hypothetical protein